MRRDASKSRATPQRILTYRAPGYWRRAAAFALWFSASAVLPGAAIANTLGGVLLFVLVIAVSVLGRMSPLPRFIAARERGFVESLRASTRTRVRVVAPATSALVATVAGFAAWLVPFLVAGAAIRNESLGGTLAATALVLGFAWAMHRLVFAHRRVGLTVGLDGVAVDGQGFAAWRELSKIAATRVVMPAGDTQPALVLDVERGGETERWTVPMDEAGATILARELEGRRSAKPPEPGADLSDALVTAGAVPWRDAAVPVADLVWTMRDPGAGREERVRVAEMLRVHAPDEVDRFAEETADAELEAELAGAATPSKREA